jgi:hypothetical protein
MIIPRKTGKLSDARLRILQAEKEVGSVAVPMRARSGLGWIFWFLAFHTLAVPLWFTYVRHVDPEACVPKYQVGTTGDGKHPLYQNHELAIDGWIKSWLPPKTHKYDVLIARTKRIETEFQNTLTRLDDVRPATSFTDLDMAMSELHDMYFFRRDGSTKPAFKHTSDHAKKHRAQLDTNTTWAPEVAEYRQQALADAESTLDALQEQDVHLARGKLTAAVAALGKGLSQLEAVRAKETSHSDIPTWQWSIGIVLEGMRPTLVDGYQAIRVLRDVELIEAFSFAVLFGFTFIWWVLRRARTKTLRSPVIALTVAMPVENIRAG